GERGRDVRVGGPALDRGDRPDGLTSVERRDEIASSWSDLQDRLFDTPLDHDVGRFRTGFVFRGVGNAANARLTTSLMRLGGDPGEKEQHLLRNFRKYAF